MAQTLQAYRRRYNLMDANSNTNTKADTQAMTVTLKDLADSARYRKTLVPQRA